VVGLVGFSLNWAAVAVAVVHFLQFPDLPLPSGVWGCYRQALRRWGALLAWCGLFTLAAVPFLIVFPLGGYLAVRWSFAWPVIALEGAGPVRALARSWELTAGRWWHTLVIQLGVWLLYGAPYGAVLFLVFGAALLVDFEVPAWFSWAVFPWAEMVWGSLEIAACVVGYFELRARLEGLDLAQRAASVRPP
jgi:hypothetical protein